MLIVNFFTKNKKLFIIALFYSQYYLKIRGQIVCDNIKRISNS